ncbi:unnamed protein product, partial [Amoebophrya sp. A120]
KSRGQFGQDGSRNNYLGSSSRLDGRTAKFDNQTELEIITPCSYNVLLSGERLESQTITPQQQQRARASSSSPTPLGGVTP